MIPKGLVLARTIKVRHGKQEIYRRQADGKEFVRMTDYRTGRDYYVSLEARGDFKTQTSQWPLASEIERVVEEGYFSPDTPFILRPKEEKLEFVQEMTDAMLRYTLEQQKRKKR